MNNPKISVIVPVYKAERYLHKCVDSLLAQTFQDYEILLIDDGSPDRSGEICDEYAKKDSRVRVFHKENGGVSSARQCGLDNAQGEYTIHVDPDDWVEPDMLEELYKKAKEEDADMVICDFFVNVRKEQLYISQYISDTNPLSVVRLMFQKLHGSFCNKLIKRACYRKFDIRIPSELNMCEDLYTVIRLLLNPIKISYVNKAYYHYIQDINAESVSKSVGLNTYDYDMKLRKYFECLPYPDDETYHCFKIWSGYFIFRRAFFSRSYSNQEFKEKIGVYYSDLKRFPRKDDSFTRCLMYIAVNHYRQAVSIWFFTRKIVKALKKVVNRFFDSLFLVIIYDLIK